MREKFQEPRTQYKAGLGSYLQVRAYARLKLNIQSRAQISMTRCMLHIKTPCNRALGFMKYLITLFRHTYIYRHASTYKNETKDNVE